VLVFTSRTEPAKPSGVARGERVSFALPQAVSVSRGGESGIYLLYLQTRYRIPKVRVAVEFLVGRLGAG